MVFKLYPCNHFTDAGVDAALRLRAQGLTSADVTAIELGVVKPVLRTIAEPPEAKARPASGYHAAFSGPYTVAAALHRVVPARSRTSPTSRSTRKCLDAPGWVIPSSWANSVTGPSPARSSTRISRRCCSAIALKTSDVVAARAMSQSYSDIGIRQAGRNHAGLVR